MLSAKPDDPELNPQDLEGENQLLQGLQRVFWHSKTIKMTEKTLEARCRTRSQHWAFLWNPHIQGFRGARGSGTKGLPLSKSLSSRPRDGPMTLCVLSKHYHRAHPVPSYSVAVSCYVSQAGLELTVLLPRPRQCQDGRWV